MLHRTSDNVDDDSGTTILGSTSYTTSCSGEDHKTNLY